MRFLARRLIPLFPSLTSVLLGACGLFQPDHNSCIDKFDNGSGFNSYELQVSAAESAPVTLPFYENQQITKEGSVFLGCKRKTITVALCNAEPCPAAKNTPEEEVLVIKGGTAAAGAASPPFVASSLKVQEGTYNIITDISGYWSVREKNGEKRCLLSTGDTETECKATDGRGLFINIGAGTEEKEVTSIYTPGQQTGSITKGTLSDQAEGAIAFQYKHIRALETGENIDSMPGSPDYQYTGSGYVLHVTVCDSTNLKQDGQCMKAETVEEGGDKVNKFYFSEFDGDGACNQDGDYTNNYGYYTVKLKGSGAGFVSKFFATVITALVEFIYGSDTKPGILPALFTAFVSDRVIITLANSAIMLSIIFVGYGYIAGISSFSWERTVKDLFKYIFLIAVVNPQGWDLVRLIIGVLFSDGVIAILTIVSDSFNDVLANTLIPATKINMDINTIVKYATETSTALEPMKEKWQNVFAIYDNILRLLFNKEIHKKLFGLLVSFPIGTLMTLLTYTSMLFIIFTMFRVLLSVIYALIYSAIVIMIFPIGLIFFIFKKTSRIMDSIISFLLLFLLMPIVVIPGSMSVGYILYASFFSMMSFTACYGCAMYLKFPDPFGVVCLIKAYYPWGASPERSLLERIANFPIKYYHAGMYLFSAYAFKEITEYCERLVHEMANASHYFSPTEKINVTQGKVVSHVMGATSSSLRNMQNFSSLVSTGKPYKGGGTAPAPQSPPPPPPASRPETSVVNNQTGEASFGNRRGD